MLGIPSARAEKFEGVGAIHAFRRLLEYGWDRESPPLAHARRVLFRLLAEDEDPAYLYELAGKGTPDHDTVVRGRMLLREAAASVLAQAGYEGDPRLRGAARRIMERVGAFLKSPLAEKPFIRVATSTRSRPRHRRRRTTRCRCSPTCRSSAARTTSCSSCCTPT